MHRQAIFCLYRPTTTTPMFMFIHKQLALIAILRKVQTPKAQIQDLKAKPRRVNAKWTCSRIIKTRSVQNIICLKS